MVRKLASAVVVLCVLTAITFAFGSLLEQPPAFGVEVQGDDGGDDVQRPPPDSRTDERGDEVSVQVHNVINFMRKLRANGRQWSGKLKATHVNEAGELVVDNLVGSIHVTLSGTNHWQSTFTFCSENRRHNPFCSDGYTTLRVVNRKLFVVLGTGENPEMVPANVLETTADSLTYTFKEVQTEQSWVTTIHENLTPDGRYMRSEIVQTQGQISETNLFNGRLPTPTPTPRPTATPRN